MEQHVCRGTEIPVRENKTWFRHRCAMLVRLCTTCCHSGGLELSISCFGRHVHIV